MKRYEISQLKKLVDHQLLEKFDLDIFLKAFYLSDEMADRKLYERKWNELNSSNEFFKKETKILDDVMSGFEKNGMVLGNFEGLMDFMTCEIIKQLKSGKSIKYKQCFVAFDVTASSLDKFSNGIKAVKKGTSVKISGSIPRVLYSERTQVLIPVIGKTTVEFYSVALNTPGISVIDTPAIDPSLRLCTLKIKNLSLTASDKLGSLSLEKISGVLNIASVMASSMLLGIAIRSLFMASEHSKTRIVGGQAICKNQVIAHRQVDMYIEIEKLRSLLLYIGEVYGSESFANQKALASMAQYTSVDTALNVTQNAIQIFGARGFRWDHPMNFLLRRSLFMRSMFGDKQDHLEFFGQHILNQKKLSEQDLGKINLAVFDNESNRGKHDNVEVFQ